MPSTPGGRPHCEGAGEFRSTSTSKEGLIVLGGGVTKKVRYAEIEGFAIVEGDIVVQPNAAVPEGLAITGDHYRWPNKTVPYQIDPDLPNQGRVTDAIAHWQEKTPIRFVERVPSNQDHKHYIFFTDQGGCFSAVGRQGGRQVLSLAAGCTTGNAIHEIGHAVGLWHEQSREDRDDFVTVHFDNVMDGLEHNFNQQIDDGDDIGAYDYGSIMHYPRNAFTRNGKDTIVPKGDQSIGQRGGLSAGDIAAVKALYP